MIYYKSDFKFDDEARNWVLERYRHRFTKHFNHDLDAEQYTGTGQAEWHASPAGQQLIAYLETLDLDTSYYGISAFVSNSVERFIGNPHIDSRFDREGNATEIKTRFNVLVQGVPEDPMFWWHNWTWYDPRLNPDSFELNGVKYKFRTVPGNSPELRWEILEIPDFTATNLVPSAFVRVNCAHTVTVSPGPRIVVSVALDKTIHEIFGL